MTAINKKKWLFQPCGLRPTSARVAGGGAGKERPPHSPALSVSRENAGKKDGGEDRSLLLSSSSRLFLLT